MQQWDPTENEPIEPDDGQQDAVVDPFPEDNFSAAEAAMLEEELRESFLIDMDEPSEEDEEDEEREIAMAEGEKQLPFHDGSGWRGFLPEDRDEWDADDWEAYYGGVEPPDGAW